MQVAILLENIRSMHNVGSFFRTGDAAGITKVYITGYTACPPREQISKVALGAEDIVDWVNITDIDEAIAKIKSDGYQLVAVEQTSNSIPLWSMDWSSPICLVFGHETDGVSQETLDKCEKILEVPMHGQKESLNVSVCAGVVLMEARRAISTK